MDLSGWFEGDCSGGGVEGQGPSAFVGEVVVSGAEGHHVVEVGWAAVFPVVDVVDLAVVVWGVALGYRAGGVDGLECSSLGGGGESFASSDVDGDAVAVEDDGDDVGLVIWIPGFRPETTFLRSEPPFMGFVVMLSTISRVSRRADECVAAPGSPGVSRRGS